jgi:hypothetical protein
MTNAIVRSGIRAYLEVLPDIQITAERIGC